MAFGPFSVGLSKGYISPALASLTGGEHTHAGAALYGLCSMWDKSQSLVITFGSSENIYPCSKAFHVSEFCLSNSFLLDTALHWNESEFDHICLQESNTESRFYEEQTNCLPLEEELQIAAGSGARVKFNNQNIYQINQYSS